MEKYLQNPELLSRVIIARPAQIRPTALYDTQRSGVTDSDSATKGRTSTALSRGRRHRRTVAAPSAAHLPAGLTALAAPLPLPHPVKTFLALRGLSA
eukprot:scaffold36467_cov58-Phaeocystis_antarctica.AAC.4